MRLVLVIAMAVLVAVGSVAALVGVEVGYRAIDPDAYRDSKPIVYVSFGGIMLAIAFLMFFAAFLLSREMTGRATASWQALPFLLAAMVPYGTLLGTSTIVANVVLAALAAGFWRRASTRTTRLS